MELSLLTYNDLHELAIRAETMGRDDFADLVMAFLTNDEKIITDWCSRLNTTKEMLRCYLENYAFLSADLNELFIDIDQTEK